MNREYYDDFTGRAGRVGNLGWLFSAIEEFTFE